MREELWSLCTTGLYLRVHLAYYMNKCFVKSHLGPQGGLYSHVVANSGLTVFTYVAVISHKISQVIN